MPDARPAALTVVGIGADGWPGLTGPARAAVESAEVVLGGARRLDLLPPSVGGEQIAWPARAGPRWCCIWRRSGSTRWSASWSAATGRNARSRWWPGSLPALGSRVFLTTGRQEIAAFAGLDQCWFLARSVEPPEPPMPRRIEVLLDRGPFTVPGERALLTDHRIDVLVTKDSGDADAKLAAARALGVPVLMIDRPPPPPAPVAETVAAAVHWLAYSPQAWPSQPTSRDS